MISVEYSASSTELMSRGRGSSMVNWSRMRPGWCEIRTTRLPRRGGFADIVGDEDNRFLARLPDGLDVAVELLAGQRVEGGKGLVHEEDAGIRRQGAGEGDPLFHTPGKLVDIRVGEALEPDELDVEAGDPRGARHW